MPLLSPEQARDRAILACDTPYIDDAIPRVAAALRAAQKEAVEACLDIVMTAEQLVRSHPGIEFVAPEKMAADLAADIADNLRDAMARLEKGIDQDRLP